MNFIKFFDQINLTHRSLVGGKCASLGEMITHLKAVGIRVPYGFALTADAFNSFIVHNQLQSDINALLNEITLSKYDLSILSLNAQKIRDKIVNGQFPLLLATSISNSYLLLSENNESKLVDVAVRSSSLSEDSATNSFAGQQDTYLHINGIDALLLHIKKCYASLYTDRAISYREGRISSDENQLQSMAVAVQIMVRSDLACSGVMFSLDTESGFRDAVVINGSWGLGELIVGGQVDPDEFIVFKKTLHTHRSIIEKKLGTKKLTRTYSGDVETAIHNQKKFCLTEDQIIELAQCAVQIEKHYQCPVDIEWAIDGPTQQVYIVQCRPETVVSKKLNNIIEQYSLIGGTYQKLVTGVAIGEKIGSGKVKIIHSIKDQKQVLDFQQNDILVTEMTEPEWEPLMKKASAIITNRGGRTCHAAIISRELGIPSIVGTDNATTVLKHDQDATVSCAEGEIGVVYKGIIASNITRLDTSLLPKCRTQIMFNVGSPETAFKSSFLPNQGVGLAREEFIISSYIKAHPNALINMNKPDFPSDVKAQLDNLIVGYNDGIDYYVNKLAYGIAKIGASFYPNEVIVRFSDFKSNEYRNLLGGDIYEPHEENPMIGFRGASRYYSSSFKHAFGLECIAINKVREQMGLTNVIVMIPFCRTPEECKQVYHVMKEYGLERGKGSVPLKVYLMCEIPSNVILAEQFCQMIDGFSIGSNDLTQLTLGLDRDSHLVAHIYNEMNPAVQAMIKNVVEVAHRNKVKIGICGQGPSDNQNFVRFLIDIGIDSISITPDSVIKVIENVAKVEKEKEKN